MNVVEIRIDVHRSPSQSGHTGMELEFHIVDVWSQKIFADGFDFGDNSFIFFQDVKEFVVVHFKLFFLEENNSGAFRDGNALSVKTFGLSDKLHNVDIKVYVEFLLSLMSDNQSGLESGLGSFNFLDPQVIIPHFVDGQHFTKSVVVSIVLLDFGRVDDVWWELGDWASDLLIQVF